MAAFTPTATLTATARHVLRTLLYYDIFSYPLRAEEISNNIGGSRCSRADLQNVLEELCEEELIFRSGGYYMLHDDSSMKVRREKGNALAQKRLPLAARMSGLISSFPFVRGVGISGSLSKNYMDEKSDID